MLWFKLRGMNVRKEDWMAKKIQKHTNITAKAKQGTLLLL